MSAPLDSPPLKANSAPSLTPITRHTRSAANAQAQAKGGYTRSLLSLADTLTMGVAGSISTLSYPPLIAGARFAIVSMMSHAITWGRLRVLTADHGVYTFPPYDKRPFEQGEEVAEIRVIRDTFWIRLVTLGDLGFAEAYMAGDCEVSDLVQIFKIFIRSRPALQNNTNISGVSTIPSRLFSMVTALTNSRFANTLSNSLSNIQAHYDLSNGMFSAFLSRDMTYSCAIYPELDADLRDEALDGHGYRTGQGREEMNGGMGLKRIVNGQFGLGRKELESEGSKDGKGKKGGEVDELEEAQLRKLRHIIKKADIRAGHRVLEIGSGWGSMSIEAVKLTNCTVDTLTLSEQQKALAEERIKQAGLAGRIRVHLMDYRAMPESWKGQFDRVVSIEMIEAVGMEFTKGYFGVIDWALNERGVACVQAITIPEARFEKYQQEVDFIRKWIFPGGFLPTVTYLVDCASAGSGNKLVVDSISNIGPHYAQTLREWRRRFVRAFANQIEPALRLEHPEMGEEDIEVFKRKWIYYFCYCEVGFSERVLGDHIVTWVREGYADYGCQSFE